MKMPAHGLKNVDDADGGLQALTTSTLYPPSDIDAAARFAVASLSAEPRARAGRAFTIVTVVLSTFIALFSYRYVFRIGPMAPSILHNLFARPWLAIHAAGASTALLLGSIQFSGALRRRWPAGHRWNGRVYVVGCLAGGVSGLVLAFGSTAGPIATVGFGGLAVAWIVTNVRGWRLAVSGRFADHREWMTRSFAATLSAVTLRLYLLLMFLLRIPYAPGYLVITFLCWVPNLVVAEVYLRARRRARALASPAALSTSP